MYDDPFLLNLLKNPSVHGVLYEQAVHHQIGRPLFGPLLFLSLKLDLQFFGLKSEAFYVHQLVAFALLPTLLYLLLRLWNPVIPSLCAAGVCMAAGPMCDVVPQIMLRHYIEGAVFAIAAVILFVFAIRRGSWPLAILSAFLYLCASSAKEVYVPLPVLFAVIPEGAIRQRARLALPHVVAAVVYTIWRLLVVGFGLGPFGFVFPPGRSAELIVTLPFRAVREFAGSGSAAGWALLVAVVGCAAIVLIRIRSSRLVALMGIAAALLPIIPVAGDMQPRWSLTLWLLATLSIGFLASAVPRYGVAIAGIVLVLAAVFWRVEWPRTYRRFLRMSDEARVLSVLGENDILRMPAVPSETMLELKRLTGSPAQAIYDDLPLCDGRMSFRRVFEYDPERREIREADRAAVERSCSRTRRMPLQIQISFAPNGSMYWTAGPYADGTWTFILWDGMVAYDVPRVAGFRAPGFDRFSLRVRYTSPAGWKTYTPMLNVDARNGPLVYRQ